MALPAAAAAAARMRGCCVAHRPPLRRDHGNASDAT